MKKIYIAISVLVLLATIFLVVYTIQKPDPTSQTTDVTPKKLTIVTTIYPLKELAQKVVGDRTTVEAIIPGGVEPHDYEPTAQSIIAIKNADIFIYNGMPSIEPWLEKVLPFIPTVTAINISNGMKTIDGDPHYWLNPENNIRAVDMILSVLVQKDRPNADMYQKNADVIKEQLRVIDRAYITQLATCAIRDVVVSHDAYGYMAEKYRFKTHPIAGLSPESEPDAKTIAQLISFVREKKIPYILFETLASPKIAETIARETGASTLVLNPIEGLTDEDVANNQDMISILWSNLGTLKKAMKCTP